MIVEATDMSKIIPGKCETQGENGREEEKKKKGSSNRD